MDRDILHQKSLIFSFTSVRASPQCLRSFKILLPVWEERKTKIEKYQIFPLHWLHTHYIFDWPAVHKIRFQIFRQSEEKRCGGLEEEEWEEYYGLCPWLDINLSKRQWLIEMVLQPIRQLLIIISRYQVKISLKRIHGTEEFTHHRCKNNIDKRSVESFFHWVICDD